MYIDNRYSPFWGIEMTTRTVSFDRYTEDELLQRLSTGKHLTPEEKKKAIAIGEHRRKNKKR